MQNLKNSNAVLKNWREIKTKEPQPWINTTTINVWYFLQWCDFLKMFLSWEWVDQIYTYVVIHQPNQRNTHVFLFVSLVRGLYKCSVTVTTRTILVLCTLSFQAGHMTTWKQAMPHHYERFKYLCVFQAGGLKLDSDEVSNTHNDRVQFKYQLCCSRCGRQ